MGFVYEEAVTADDGGLSERADEASRALASAAFCKALDDAPAPPLVTSMDRVVVLGIGGSALGARCVHEACAHGAQRPLIVVDNIDPEPFERAWELGDPDRTAWVVISKSGGTTEPLTQWKTLRERLGDRGELHVVTGPTGSLREAADAEGLNAYPVPVPVGGRFSLFTSAATVPLALAGHDVGALLSGAKAARDHCSQAGNAAARLASLLTAAQNTGRNVVTLWSYAERLESVGEWFRQLWGESLGKDGKGQTPVHCVGSTDQHSMQQLMVEGPPDKSVLVLSGPGDGSEMATILEAMRRATTSAMVRAGSPAATMRLGDYGEASVGALLMTLLCTTVLAGELMGVDPYGQPGVEAAKVATKQLLADPGGEADREIAKLLGEDDGQHCP